MVGCDLCRQFVPHTHFEQLEKLAKWKTPKTIFVQSMGDLFHDAILGDLIETVFAACAAAPQHRYMFLTKNPARYLKLLDAEKLPVLDNHWYGSTVTRMEDNYLVSGEHNTFVSAEPLLAPPKLVMEKLWKTHLVIIGAETGHRKGRVIPNREWIDDIVRDCRESGVPIFMKDSLIPIVGEENMRRELPWEVQP